MVRQNVIANLAGRIWGILSLYIFVPFYIRFLGAEAYGLVGFYSTLVGVIAFADIGLTATLSREMARISVIPDAEGKLHNLVRTYETLYSFIMLFVACSIWILAPSIADHWLKVATMPKPLVATAVRLMGITVAFQLKSGLFAGGLMGLQRQVLTNILQIVWGVLRSVGAIFLLWLASRSIIVFFVWQAACNLAYLVAVRTFLLASLPRTCQKPRFDIVVLKETWSYASGMILTSILSIILSQSDKVILSKTLDLRQFGFYTLVSMLSVIPISLANPLANAFFPHFTNLVSLGKKEDLLVAYHKACFLISAAVFPCAMTIAAFSKEFLIAWTGSTEMSNSVSLVATILMLGQIFQSLQLIPYYLSLSFGRTKNNIILGLLSIIILLPCFSILVPRMGMIGASLAWLLMNLITFPPYILYIHRKVLGKDLRQWLLGDVLTPIIPALILIFIARILVPIPSNRIALFSLLGGIAVLASTAAFLPSREARSVVKRLFRKGAG